MTAVPESAARLSPEREAEIAARAEAATPGPWFVHPDWPGRVFSESEFNAHVARVTGSNPEHNEQFIAHARTDVPALLAELAAVRAERDQARERALREAADHFNRMADREPDPHGYRARVMRGAANDIRRLIEEPAR
ncbi:hypothetical protein ACFW4Q_02260 [Streptomyces rochei]|uniref:hypothetical protein n=1 Tax=Streptomyces rochei TaxID=1928 RepID=UPI0036A671CF